MRPEALTRMAMAGDLLDSFFREGSSLSIQSLDSLVQVQRNNQVEEHNDLWHACAGPTVKVPCVGDKVFYFPQGHLEQVEAHMKQEGMGDIPFYGLPSKILCEVVGLQLKAEVESEELFAKITLLPYCEEAEGSRVRRSVAEKIPASFLRKRLTPSDISRQGGCSLHKRDVHQTLPPLDMSQEKPSQQLIAEDLHGNLWKFHHICRGVPKRHLLTTGWGTFVNAKKLLVGDTFVFLRGRHQMYVGIQRAVKVRVQKKSTDLTITNMRHGVLVTALEALHKRTEFTLYYHPSISPSGFIVGYDEFMESCKVNYAPKMRVGMISDEGGDDPQFNMKKFSGTIIGKEDADPFRWPQSEWRCLKVCWDATSPGDAPPERVSPWSIRSLESVVPHQQPLVSVGQKRSIPWIGYNQGIREGRVLTLPKVNFASSSCKDGSKKKCTIFGVDISKQQSQNNCGVSVNTPTYIKVFQHGDDLGRAIDISGVSGYGGLVWEIDRMFGFQGTLVSGKSQWHVTYADGDGNKKRLGNLSWVDFRGVVRKMLICPKEKVPTWNGTKASSG